MGTMPVKKLLVTMSLPMMLSMLVQALYNVVDSIFVAQLSEQALTAVSLGFPLQNLMIAVGSGTGVGVNALLSRSLGEKDHKTANDIARHGIFLPSGRRRRRRLFYKYRIFLFRDCQSLIPFFPYSSSLLLSLFTKN